MKINLILAYMWKMLPSFCLLSSLFHFVFPRASFPHSPTPLTYGCWQCSADKCSNIRHDIRLKVRLFPRSDYRYSSYGSGQERQTTEPRGWVPPQMGVKFLPAWQVVQRWNGGGGRVGVGGETTVSICYFVNHKIWVMHLSTDAYRWRNVCVCILYLCLYFMFMFIFYSSASLRYMEPMTLVPTSYKKCFLSSCSINKMMLVPTFSLTCRHARWVMWPASHLAAFPSPVPREGGYPLLQLDSWDGSHGIRTTNLRVRDKCTNRFAT